MSFVDGHHLMNITYANSLGISPIQLAKTRPLHSVAMHDAEETGINSLLYDRLRAYTDNGVMKHYGLSWKAFKQLSHEEADLVMALSEAATRRDTTVTDNALNDIERSAAGKKN